MSDKELKPVKSIAVARRFHDIGRGKFDEQQLQKLTYYTHGWSLAFFGAPLTADVIEAWELGPAYPEMSEILLEDDMDAVLRAAPAILGVTQKKLVKKVYESYGHYSGIELSESTHERHDLNPWHHVWNVRGQRKGIIEDSLIENYFRIRLAPLYRAKDVRR